MKAIILAAGFATRMYPLTYHTPKPLLNVRGQPIIDYILEKLNEIPLDEIIIITNHRFYNDFAEWGRGKDVKIIDNGVNSEEEKKGAVGDMAFVIESEKIDDDVLVISGDNFFEFSLKEPYEIFKRDLRDVAIFHDIGDFEESKRFGVGLAENGILVDFEEKPENPKSTLCSTSTYLYRKETLPILKEFALTKADQPGLFLKELHKRIPVRVHTVTEKWIDIGTMEAFERANN